MSEGDPTPGPSTDLTSFTTRKIYVYVLRNTPADARIKIKASFDKEIRYTFNQVEVFSEKDATSPSIYILELPIDIDHQQRLIVGDANERWFVGTYRLRLSRKIPHLDKSFPDYKDDQDREFLNPRSTTHYFLFDVNFGKNVMNNPPGHNVPFWSQLCLFTYYILRHEMYDVFDSLVEQFQRAMEQTPRPLPLEALNDFFQTCFVHSTYALSHLANSWMADRILIRMTGLLPITRTNLDITFHFTRNFTGVLIEDIKEHFDHLFALLNDRDWPLFRDGFSLYLAIELLSRTGDSVALVNRLRNEDCKRDLANVLLKRLETLQRPVLGVNWIELFTLVDPNILTLKQLQLTRSIETYIMSLVKILGKHVNEMDMDTKIIRHFDESIYNDRLTVNLETIVFLLKFLSLGSTEEDQSSKNILAIVNRAIEESNTLRAKIRRYLYDLPIVQEQFKDVRLIISSLSKSIILYSIAKNDLLKNLLHNTTLPKTATFLKQWFYNFLLFDDEVNDANKKMYFDVLQNWSQQFIKDQDVTVRILQEIDLFIHALNIPEYRAIFIQHMVELCFKQKFLFRVIEDGLLDLHQEAFLDAFKQRFAALALTVSPERLKQMTNYDNPLHSLIRLYGKTKGESVLIKDLIVLTALRIQFTSQEILRDTFDYPSQTSCIYAVLFEECFNKSELRQTLVDQLLVIWAAWEDEGFHANQIIGWKGFSPEQRDTVQRIWTYMSEVAKKQFHIDILIDRQQKEMEEKIQIKEQIIQCLENSCQHACDKEIYLDLLSEMELALRSKIVRSIQVPEEIAQLLPLARRLNPLEKLHSWKIFLAQHQRKAATTIETASSPTIDSDLLLDDQKLSSSSRASLLRNSNIVKAHGSEIIDRRACLMILQDQIKILDDFIERWTEISTNWEISPISELLVLFADVKYIDHDLEILRTLKESNSLSDLKLILAYWKNREYINNVCHGWINILEQLNVSIDQKLLEKLQEIPEINQETLGLRCGLYYEYFLKTFLKKYSNELLAFVAEFSLSKDLITFLNTVALPEVDNLLHAVNDWDETLINTKTVLDFVVLKRFLVQVGANFDNSASGTAQASFDRISEAFEVAFKQEEFGHIFQCFRACSASLISIKRIHLELTDKELSKRKRISDLMHDSSLGLVGQSNRFDIQIEPHGMSFTDLSELRDRARLIEYSITNATNQFEIKHRERGTNELTCFVTFVEIVEKVLKNFTSLNIAGHPGIVDHLSPQKTFTCHLGQYQPLIEFSLMLDDLLYAWEIHLCQMYERHLDLTHFAYQQIWMIEDYVYNHLQLNSKDHPGYHLLKFIDIQPDTIRPEFLPNRSDNANDRLEIVGRILSAQRNNGIHEKKEEARGNKKVYLVESSEQGILRAILSLFRYLQTRAAVNHLFYCTEETTWTEIRAFTYRCFFSQRLHQLIHPEFLSASIQDHLSRLLRELIEQYPQQYFRLAILTTMSNAHLQLINGLRNLQIVQTVHDQDMLTTADLHEMMEKIVQTNTILVTSRINGLGKSSFIRNEITQSKQTYLKFPISGDINADDIAERLRKHGNTLASGKTALHIDIGAISQVKQLNELLYCLLLFRSFRLGQVAVHVPQDVRIYIELDSSPSSASLYEKIAVFKSMPCKVFERIDWKSFQIPDKTALRFVVNYLHAIETGSILRQNLGEENLRDFDLATSIELLKRPFLENKDPNFVTWTQLSIFLSVYHQLFSRFSRCGFFMIDSLANPILRTDLLKTLLNSSNQFTSMCVENVRKNQRSVHDNTDTTPFSEAIVRWDKTQPFTMVFSDGDSPIFVYKKPTDVPVTLIEVFRENHEIITKKKCPNIEEFLPDYGNFSHREFFFKLASLSKKYLNKSICLKCYRQYSYTQLECAECKTAKSVIRPISIKNEDIARFQALVANRLQTEYVLTADNFIKMLLIYLRVECGLPVLIMGETGCGKTALIQFLCQKILDDEMVIFRIHAGVTSEMIIETMGEYSTLADIHAQQQKRLWVFLDEFNTTTSIGLIKEIACERTLLGQPLPKNMVLLGACNPQRRNKEKKVSDNNVGIKKDLYEIERLKESAGVSLLYTVVSIPETMLEYIWDYGYLDSGIEQTYIRTMLNTCRQLKEDATWCALTVKLIAKSQKFFREFEDVSSVSLRDVARFCRLYNWFRESILQREGAEKFSQNITTLLRRATLTALLLCYYFRLSSSEDRQAYTDQMEETLRPILLNIANVPHFLKKILETEQKRLIDRMDLPPGTARNRALIDNIFVLLVCIVNRIPVMICGKPGCSKTSAVQIVISNLKGKKSSDPYFQTLPELITVSYQGSQNCTSESIVKVFQRADKYLNVNRESNLLPVIVFDEIGLAELSPHNPLKVLHSKLEVETCLYGFVGLSNWRLDASKMNRALYLSCPDPSVEDLQLTAKTIAESITPTNSQLVPIDELIIKALANSYYQLYEYLQNRQEQERYINYFGLRDFYSLVKGVVNDLIKNEGGADPYECVRRQLIINFDGILDGSQFMWEYFCDDIRRKHLIPQYQCPTFKQLLDQRLKSRHGRYLMLIADNESVIDYVERYIIVKHQPPPVRTLIGSCFSGDLIAGTTYTEKYNYRVLMDVILYAETNVTLVMRRMGHLYDNLYDLFNQNFAVSGKKQYCRIALGALYHPRCLVNEDFYCVVFVRKDDLAKCDPPFLNRFEKHLVDMKSLVHQQHWLITKNYLSDLSNLIPTNIHKYFPLLQHLFVDYSPDYICNLVIDAFDQLKIADHDESNTSAVIDYCQSKLIRTSSFDLPLILSLKSDQVHPLIDQYYSTHTNLSLQGVLRQALAEEVLPHQIIYTYTQLYHDIDYQSAEVKEIILSIFKTELELTDTIKRHYQSKDRHRLLIIRLDYHQEHEHVLLLKHILLNSKLSETNRGVWLICHLQRNLLNQINNDVLFNGWSTLMINDLNNNKLLPKELLLNPLYRDLVIHPDFSLSGSMLDELIDRCLTKFRYTVSQQNQVTEINKRRNRIIEQLTASSSPLRVIIEEHLFQLVNTVTFPRFSDWRHDLLTNGLIIGTCRSFNDALQAVKSLFFETYLLLIFSHLEKNSLIDSYLFLQTNQIQRSSLEKIWNDCLRSTLKTIDTNIINIDVIEMPLIFHLHLPCAMIEYEIIRSICQLIDQRREDDVQEDDLTNLAMKQLRMKSVYGENIDLIFNDEHLSRFYYHDQLLLAQNEGKVHGLSLNFIQCLLTSNPMRTWTDRMKHLLSDSNEFFEILRLFEIGTNLIDEKKFIDEVLKQQLTVIDASNEPKHRNDRPFYHLVLTSEHFCLVPPESDLSNDDHRFNCAGDCFIEVSLMNLIEYLVSRPIIDGFNNIEQLTTTYSLVAQGILDLDHYSVNNLEKLRSFISLLRCITTLVSTEKAAGVFKKACLYAGFDATFQSCDDIHRFIDHLKRIVTTSDANMDDRAIHQALLKLESEFLKNWLADHSEGYLDVIKLMSQSDNSLWQYSAKIFTYIDRKLELLPLIKEHYGQVSKIEEMPTKSADLEELLDEHRQFDEHLHQLNDSSRKIEHIMVTRFHTHLILSANDQTAIEAIIQEHFVQFEENLRDIQNTTKPYGSNLISLISWLKYYAHLYAIQLINGGNQTVLRDIDELLTQNAFLFCSTLKLFIIKQLCQMSTLKLSSLRDLMIHRNITWLNSTLALPPDQRTQKARRELILPTPLFECYEEFRRVDHILTRNATVQEVRQLIDHCQKHQDSFYCFLLWFIHYYARLANSTEPIGNNSYSEWIEKDLSKEIVQCFQPIGYKFLIFLCTNFNNSTYFSLHPKMTIDDIHRRLVALNIIALLLSFKALPNSTYLSSLLFDGYLKMPEDYGRHLKTSICLPGLLSNDPIINQMLEARNTVKERLDLGQIHDPGKFIFQCSEDCLWMFYFVNCGVPVDRTKCPICKKDIGAAQYGVLIERDPPQIRRPIDEAFNFINNYVEQYHTTPRFGYHNPTSALHSNEHEKSDHLNRPISYRFMHFLTHVTLLFLDELSLLPDLGLPSVTHFQEHFEKDYQLLSQQSTSGDQCYIWLYKLINHMMNKDFHLPGYLNTNGKTVQLEKVIEEKLLFKHMDSIVEEINQYKVVYANFIQEQDNEVTLEHFVDELYQDEEKYPYLSFFNVTNIYTANPIDEFSTRLQNIPYGDTKYPVTTFLIKRLGDYANIQYLHPIVTFSNYLIEKFNHRIKRNDASTTPILYYLTHGPDSETMTSLYQGFLQAWYSLRLEKLQYGCQMPTFQRPSQKGDFAADTKLAMVLLNTTKDDSSILLAACLRSIGELQNEIVHFFHKKVLHQDSNEHYRRNAIPIQSIRPEHMLHLDSNVISKKLLNDGLTINYQYGKGKDMIYDYEEIEITLRNLISGLQLIDTEKMRFLNYQFELYSENTSLINDVRSRIKQEPLKDNERNKLKNLLAGMQNDELLHYLGSLDYVFTYLRNIDDEANNPLLTIQMFVEKYIRSNASLNDHVVQRPPFATIHLRHIISLYELIEESAFDQVLRHYVKQGLAEESFSAEQQELRISEFSKNSYRNPKTSTPLQTIDPWIGILKRLMVRVLSNVNVSLDVPIQMYLERNDLWTGDISENDLQSFEIPAAILLQHTYVILKGLENERKQTAAATAQVPASPDVVQRNPLQNSESQLSQTRTWHNDSIMSANTMTRVIKSDRPAKNDSLIKKKIRV